MRIREATTADHAAIHALVDEAFGHHEAALAAARHRGEPYMFLEGDPGYYGSRGFEPALQRGFLRPTERIPGPAFQVAVLDDRGVTGRLVYPDAFWRHGATGLRGDRLARVRAALGE